MSRGARFDSSTVFSLPSLWSAGAAFWQRAFASDFAWKVGETFATRVFLIGAGVAASGMVARGLGAEWRRAPSVPRAPPRLLAPVRGLGRYSSPTFLFP